MLVATIPRGKKIVPPTEAEITRQALADHQAQVLTLTAAVQALTVQPVVRQEWAFEDDLEVHGSDNDEDAESDVDEYPFAGGCHFHNPRHVLNDSDEEDGGHDFNRWENSFKLEIPKFHGNNVAEELLDWFVTVEEILEFKRVPIDRYVPLIAIHFWDLAAAWWTQHKTYRARLGKSKIVTWEKLKHDMRKKFLPYNYDQLMFQKFKNLRQGSRTVDFKGIFHDD